MFFRHRSFLSRTVNRAYVLTPKNKNKHISVLAGLRLSPTTYRVSQRPFCINIFDISSSTVSARRPYSRRAQTIIGQCLQTTVYSNNRQEWLSNTCLPLRPMSIKKEHTPKPKSRMVNVAVYSRNPVLLMKNLNCLQKILQGKETCEY